MACAVWASAQTQTQNLTQAPAPPNIRLQPLDVVEGHLKSFSTDNREREARIRKWFADAGCTNLSEQRVDRTLPANVVCVLPGESKETIVVGAHTDKVAAGDGVIDNWTGAVLLPALVFSLNDRLNDRLDSSRHSSISTRPLHHTFVFVGFSGEERGLVGSRSYLHHLSPAERSRIDGMVNFDSLGLGPTEVWAHHADAAMLDALTSAASASKLPVASVNVDHGASADSEAFAAYQIPRITLHSVSPETWSVLHSSADRIEAAKMSDYYDSYRLIAVYLGFLDSTLKPK